MARCLRTTEGRSFDTVPFEPGIVCHIDTVHFGKEKTQKWLMVRLDEPRGSETAKEGQK